MYLLTKTTKPMFPYNHMLLSPVLTCSTLSLRVHRSPIRPFSFYIFTWVSWDSNTQYSLIPLAYVPSYSPAFALYSCFLLGSSMFRQVVGCWYMVLSEGPTLLLASIWTFTSIMLHAASLCFLFDASWKFLLGKKHYAHPSTIWVYFLTNKTFTCEKLLPLLICLIKPVIHINDMFTDANRFQFLPLSFCEN